MSPSVKLIKLWPKESLELKNKLNLSRTRPLAKLILTWLMLQILTKLSVSGLQLIGVEPFKHHLGASDGWRTIPQFFQTTFEIHKHSVYLL
jgi:hypothetical protein